MPSRRRARRPECAEWRLSRCEQRLYEKKPSLAAGLLYRRRTTSHNYFAMPPLLWHVLAMCFTELTSKVCELPLACPVAPVAVPPALGAAELEVPMIFTSWPTCSLSLAVSP